MAVPSLALTSLSIRDFRGIHELDLDFRGPDGNPNQLLVLAGPNGCGKTAVLEAGLLVVDVHLSIETAALQNTTRRGASRYQIRAGIWSNGTMEEVSTPGSHPRLIDNLEGHKATYFPSRRSATTVGAVNPTVGATGSPVPSESVGNTLWAVKQSLVNAAAIERFGDVPTARRGYTAIIKAINEAWHGFYPERSDSFAVGITQSKGTSNGSFDVFLCTADGVRLEVDLLSSGQLELFLFISTLALSGDREGIVFIDEPELHLDPQWHRLILRSLIKLQPRVQFIVATHSPEIYDEARSYERHFLVPEGDPRARLWPPVKQDRTGD